MSTVCAQNFASVKKELVAWRRRSSMRKKVGSSQKFVQGIATVCDAECLQKPQELPGSWRNINLKSAVERGSFDQTMDEMDVVDPVDFTRKGIDFLVHFVHKVHDVQRITHRIRS